MRFVITASILALCVVSPTRGEAKVAVEINLSTQTMHVRTENATYTWPVSTARGGYATPRGHYHPTFMKRIHYSRKYHMSPMPYSIFFNGGYAIHGTYETRSLGRPASHGCIRLAPSHAAHLFEMVKHEGATITIVGVAPGSGHRQKVRRASQRRAPSWQRFDDGPVGEPVWNSTPYGYE